jgi:eukaryotic-like serine/threonine-protein kinase
MSQTPDNTLSSKPPVEAVASPLEDYSGRVFGDFELIRRIGIGGMGQVYLARQKSLKRQVAIKILREELAANMNTIRRFQAEAEAVANITHANIVQVYFIGEEDDIHYMALEYVDGRNLRDFIEKKGLPDLPTSLEIMRQVAAALERAGELGFVHRDIKPENILLSKKGEVKVTDFGLSRCFSSESPLNLTQSGVAMGTPLYMSPEQVRGQPVDPRSDIYSFGVTSYHMLAGEPPFKGTAAFDVAIQHVQGEAKPLASIRPDLPADLCAIVHRMMARRPEDRYQSAREILNDLARVKEGTGLPAGTMQSGASVFAPIAGNGSTVVPATGTSGMVTQTIPAPPSPWRYLIVAALAVAAAAGGAVLHWAQTPAPAVINPDDALADVDPSPSAIREKDLKRQLNDKAVRPEVAIDDLLELAELYIADRKFDEAAKLFDMESIRKFAALEATGKETLQNREQMTIMCGLGKGIVLSYQDRADDSNAEFVKLVKNNPPPLKKDDGPPKSKKDDIIAKKAGNRGQLETFFNRTNASANWKRAVGEAIERNSKNLDGKMPDELKRLRMLPAKGTTTKGKGE